ncbi:MAG: dTMP kinase [Candidatus Aminicenantes bacterium]|nr:dTMP kinase [Candidatus Aminicenantes bacterium]
MKKGILIVFEGIDGSGKSTQVQILQKILLDKDLDVVILSEPSLSPWGQKIRKKASLPDSLTPEEELDLFVKDRKDNVQKNLKPALAKKKIILLDRYYFSTIAYQGAKGIDVERIRRINEQFAIPPDLVFILDVEAEKGLNRIQDRKNKDLLFERQDFLVEVRKIFKSFLGDNIFHINSDNTPKEISDQISSIVLNYINTFLYI